MINLDKSLLLLKPCLELYSLVGEALELIIESYPAGNDHFTLVLSKLYKLYKNEPTNGFDLTLMEWYSFVTFVHGSGHHTQIKRKQKYFPTLSASDIGRAQTTLKLIFVYLHKHKAAILTEKFSRPRGSVTALPELHKTLYAETIYPFLELELNSPHTPGTGKRTYAAAQRLWQTGIKALLMSSIFTPEDLHIEDLITLRTAPLKNKRKKIQPIPFFQICEVLRKEFPKRIPVNADAWIVAAHSDKNNILEKRTLNEDVLISTLEQYDSPFEVTLGLVKALKLGVCGFVGENFLTFNLTNHIHQGWELFNFAMKVWLKAEDAYTTHASRQKSRPLNLALGKLNVYLFVYLPLWILKNPKSKFRYPDTPAKMLGSVHYDCEAPLTAERPYSICELFRELDYKETNSSQSELRKFFSYLIDFGSDLQGCSGVKQPVRRVPSGKKHANVVKNVFTGEQLRQIIEYHYALNAGAEWYTSNSSNIKLAVEKSQREHSLVDTADLGFVPIMYHNGNISYIKKIHPGTFHFITHNHAYLYNPASVTFSLILLECGVRAQTLQWLDAETYDRISHRLSPDSLQLTTIWLNTDKIQKIPFVIVTTMGNLLLLDSQRNWRSAMIEAGVEGFAKKVFYDHEPSSQWGLIQPLFAANPLTGAPFTDGQYNKLWNCHCLNFQIWYMENTAEKRPIVGFLPKKRSATTDYFRWEDWINKIDPDKVLVTQGLPTNKVFQGDYCPISLRAYATPHSARASFITDMSINLPPEAMSMLTGQSIGTIIRYNKGHHLIHDRLQGAFNNKDAAWFLTNPYKTNLPMSEARDRIEDAVGHGNLTETIDRLGLYSFPTSTSPREMTGLKLIASDRSLSLGACYTHICPYNFFCPEQIVIKFRGKKKCAQCQFSIFSTHNIPAIEAHRQKTAEEYLIVARIMENHSTNSGISAAETSRLREELEEAAKDVISWMFVEEVLWARVEMLQDVEVVASGLDLVTSNPGAVVKHLSRAEYRIDSVEGFLTRLDSACLHPESLSRSFEYKIDRATRLLMVNDDNILGAATMPSSYPSAVKLAGMIRSSLSFDKLDMEKFVQLINLDDKTWAMTLLSHRPSKPHSFTDPHTA